MLLNNDEINEAFDRGVMGIFELDGRDVAVLVEMTDRFSLFNDGWGRRCLARRSLLVKKSAWISSHNFLNRLACPEIHKSTVEQSN